MADESISLSEDEYRFLKILHDSGVEFMIVGLSAALLQGVPAVTQVIDLWVKDLGNEKFCAAVTNFGASYIPPGVAGMNPPLLASPLLRGFDLVTTCQGLGSVEQELPKALTVRLRDVPLKVLSLASIIKSKEVANREKDRAVLPMLRAALAAGEK